MKRVAGAVILVAAIVLAVSVLTGCGNAAPTQPPQPFQCVEADGEPCDDDPLDLDDLFEKKKTPTPKPKVPGKSPAPKPTGKVRR